MAAVKKRVAGLVKLQLPAGKANPSPPVGPALGQHGVNIMQFCKDFNARSSPLGDTIVPVVITIHADRTYSFVMKSPPASILVKKALGLPTSGKPGSGSSEPNKTKVGRVTMKDVREIAQTKMPDLNASDLEAAIKIILGTARSMGVEVEA